MRSSYSCLERQRRALFSRLQQLPGDPWRTAVFLRSSCIKLCFIAALFISKAVFDKALATSVVSGRDDQRQRCLVQKKKCSCPTSPPWEHPLLFSGDRQISLRACCSSQHSLWFPSPKWISQSSPQVKKGKRFLSLVFLVGRYEI